MSERCLEGGWRLLGWLWPHPGGLSYQINWQKSIEGTLSIVLIGWFLFSQWPWIGHRMPYFGVSVRCLEDVWEVSGVVWVTLDIVWGGVGVGEGYDVKLIDTNLIWVILISWFLLSQVLQNAWRLSGKCLRGVWGLCEWLWILSGWYDVQAIDEDMKRLILFTWLIFSLLPWIGQNVLYCRVSEGCL